MIGRPGLIGVDDEAGGGGAGTDRADAIEIAVAGELHLEQRPHRILGRRLAHPLGRVEAERIGRDDGMRRVGDPGKLPDARAGLLRLEIPERPVEGVACRTRRHGALQRRAIEPAGDRLGHRLERRDDAVDSLAVAAIGHPFAAATQGAAMELGEDDFGNRAAAARDGEGLRERPALAADAEAGHRGASDATAGRRCRRRRPAPDRRRAFRRRRPSASAGYPRPRHRAPRC